MRKKLIIVLPLLLISFSFSQEYIEYRETGEIKLKEISYIHAEGYPAAEMKHGPIALIDEEMPIVVIATRKDNYEKVVSNIQEVKARGGKLIAIVT